MEEINKRITQLRKCCHKNQAEWGKILGISRSGVADIESGRRKVNGRHLVMLSNWDEFNINMDWLRNGSGEMFLSNETDVLESIRRDYKLTDTQFAFVVKFLRLPKNEKDIIFDFLSSVFSNDLKSTGELLPKQIED